MKEGLFVGVDAGGTHTVAVLARGEQPIRSSIGEPANPNAAGGESAALVIARCVERVLEGDRPAAIVAGVAGAGGEVMQQKIREILALRFPGARIAVTHDARIALRAAIPTGDGLVVIAGTGSIAYGETNGRALRAGGYGYLLGDEGSGFAIGAAAVRELLAAADSILPETPMVAELADYVGSRQRAQILAGIYQSAEPVATIAGCAPILLRHASVGDPMAVATIARAAGALYDSILELAPAFAAKPVSVALSGGLLFERNTLVEALEQHIRGAPELRLIEARRAPYFGALAQARALAMAA